MIVYFSRVSSELEEFGIEVEKSLLLLLVRSV